MSWSIGFDTFWNRDIGYGVPAWCDHPDCKKQIHRGLSYVCGGEPYGGERGCGLYFCEKHLVLSARLSQICARCKARRGHFKPKPEHPRWMKHVLKDDSWAKWRQENPGKVLEYVAAIRKKGAA